MASTPITQFIRRERGLAASAGSIPAIQTDRKPRFVNCPRSKGPSITAGVVIETSKRADQSLVSVALNRTRSELRALIRNPQS